MAKKNAPPVGEAMLRRIRSRGDSLISYLAERPLHDRWFAALKLADRGKTRDMMDLFKDAVDRDADLSGLVRKRTISMMGRPVVFSPPPGFETDAEALEVAQNVRRLLLVESRHFKRQLSHLMSATTTSYAVCYIAWKTNTRGEYVPHLQDERGRNFGYDLDRLELGIPKDAYYGGDVTPLSEYPDLFVVHEPMAGLSAYPWRRGAMRSCIVPSFIKRNALSYWLVLAERFGMPQVFAKVPAGTDHDGQSQNALVAEVGNSLESLGRHWWAVFGKDIEIDKIAGSGEAKPEVHKELTSWANTEMAIALLGQNLTTEVSGGSFAASETHRWVADDIHLADAVELAETITQQLVEPLVRYNWPGAPVPTVEITTGRKQVFKTEHYWAGICNQDEVRRTMGHEAKPNGTGSAFVDPQKPPAVPGSPTGPKPSGPGDDSNDVGGPGDTRPDE